jgi:hypothetical protein
MKLPTFKLTDSRPWYKQLVSGVLLSLELLLKTLLTVGGILLLVTLLLGALEVGVVNAILFLGALIVGFSVLIFFALIVYGLEQWSSEPPTPESQRIEPGPKD